MTVKAKRADAPRPLPEFSPCLLVFKEKHGTSYYHADNEAQLFAIALTVVRDRYEQGYWYGSEKDIEATRVEQSVRMAKLNGLRDELAKQTHETVVRALKRDRDELEREINDNVEAIRFFDMAKRAVDERNGGLAWELLQDRSQYEYERFERERIETVDELCPRPEQPRHGQSWTDEHGKRWVFDAKTINDWIPRVYAQVFYNMQLATGVTEIVRMRDEADAYGKA